MIKDWSALLDAAKLAAEAAGSFLCRREGITVDECTQRDIKLSTDKTSESIILDILKTTDIPVLSEEKGIVGDATQELLWIVDPLDGTVNYFRGLDDLACVSIALWQKQTPILGLVYRFRSREMFSGIVGEGFWLNGKPMHTAETVALVDAVLATGLPKGTDFSQSNLLRFTGAMQSVKKVRMLGAAALMGAYVAAGRVDAYREDGIMLWDIAAAAALVLAAGGEVDIKMKESNKCWCCLYATATLRQAFEALD